MRLVIQLNPSDPADALIIDWVNAAAAKYGDDRALAIHSLALWPAAAREFHDRAVAICENDEAHDMENPYTPGL